MVPGVAAAPAGTRRARASRARPPPGAARRVVRWAARPDHCQAAMRLRQVPGTPTVPGTVCALEGAGYGRHVEHDPRSEWTSATSSARSRPGSRSSRAALRRHPRRHDAQLVHVGVARSADGARLPRPRHAHAREGSAAASSSRSTCCIAANATSRSRSPSPARRSRMGTPSSTPPASWSCCTPSRSCAARWRTSFTAGDHDLVVGEVTDFEGSGGEPLIFHRGAFGGLDEDALVPSGRVIGIAGGW